eukprot:Awhi_evm1s2918
MILAVVDMVSAGKAFTVGWKTLAMYTLTTAVAALEGLVIVLVFKRWFSNNSSEEEDKVPFFQIFCDEAKSSLFERNDATGVISCVPLDISASNLTTFIFHDVNDVFVKAETSAIKSDIGLSETIQEGIFKNIVSGNIISDFSSGNFLAVICFAIFFGVALISSGKKHNKGELPPVAFSFIKECNNILVMMIEWVIKLTPFAVISLISGALAGQDDLATVFQDVGVLIGAGLLGYACHLFIFYPTLFFVFVRRNPYAYMRNIFPAQCMAFACSSSAATLPINIKCAVESREVPKTLANFVLSLGATINMDGTALYFPICIIFLGMANGEEITVASYVMIFLLSTLGSAGAAPVPSAQLVLVVTAYNTVFGSTGIPDKFGLIVLIDWFMDRCATAVNVSGDNFISRIISSFESDSFKVEEMEESENEIDENGCAQVVTESNVEVDLNLESFENVKKKE